MTAHEAAYSVLERYRLTLMTMGIEPINHADEEPLSLEHIAWMIDTTLSVEAEKWPIDKLSRWLGFIQAVLVMRGVTTVKRERDLTRPLFTQAT